MKTRLTMKKLLLILLCLPMIGFGQFLCSQLAVYEIVIDSANMTIDIAIYDGNSWTSYDVSDGLIGPVIRGLSIDSQNFLWVATSTGVSKVSNIPASISVIKQDSFVLYPNPTSGNFSISSNNEKLSKIEIYNSLGQNINTFRNVNNNSVFNINSKNQIYYFIKIYDENDKLISVERLLAY